MRKKKIYVVFDVRDDSAQTNAQQWICLFACCVEFCALAEMKIYDDAKRERLLQNANTHKQLMRLVKHRELIKVWMFDYEEWKWQLKLNRCGLEPWLSSHIL